MGLIDRIYASLATDRGAIVAARHRETLAVLVREGSARIECGLPYYRDDGSQGWAYLVVPADAPVRAAGIHTQTQPVPECPACGCQLRELAYLDACPNCATPLTLDLAALRVVDDDDDAR